MLTEQNLNEQTDDDIIIDDLENEEILIDSGEKPKKEKVKKEVQTEYASFEEESKGKTISINLGVPVLEMVSPLNLTQDDSLNDSRVTIKAQGAIGEFSDYDVESMLQQLLADGFLKSPLVAARIRDGKYDKPVVLIGNRRWKAFQKMSQTHQTIFEKKFASIPVLIYGGEAGITKAEAREVAFDHGAVKQIGEAGLLKQFARLIGAGYSEMEIVKRLTPFFMQTVSEKNRLILEGRLNDFRQGKKIVLSKSGNTEKIAKNEDQILFAFFRRQIQDRKRLLVLADFIHKNYDTGVDGNGKPNKKLHLVNEYLLFLVSGGSQGINLETKFLEAAQKIITDLPVKLSNLKGASSVWTDEDSKRVMRETATEIMMIHRGEKPRSDPERRTVELAPIKSMIEANSSPTIKKLLKAAVATDVKEKEAIIGLDEKLSLFDQAMEINPSQVELVLAAIVDGKTITIS